MIDCKDLILDVEQAFESKRSHKEYLYSVKKDQLLTNADYKKVCEDLSQTIFDWNKAEFLEDTELANRLSLQVENLKQKKAQLEIKYGLKEFEPDCPICKDFGVTDNGRCQCFYTHLNNLCYEELGLKTPLLNLLGADATTWDATAGYLFWTTTLGTLPAVLNVTISYFVRAEGASLHASIGTMSGCILNIILDPIFILPWGLNMGAAGAGCATFIANVVACLYFAVFLIVKRGKTFVCISPKKFRFEKHIAKDIFVVGIPASIQNLLNVTGMTILNNFTASFGNVDATAAMGIAHKVAMVPMYISNGLSQGIMPLISYNFASGNVKRMKSTLKFTVCISLVIIVVISLAMFILSAPITKLFLNDPDVIGFGRDFLRGYSLSLPFLCFDFVGVAVFQACGMGGKSLVFAILRKIILEIPALIVLNKIFPLVGLSYAQFVAEFILAFAALFVLIKMFKKLEKDSPKFSE